MFEYPSDFIQIGKPIAEVIRFNASRGEYGPGDVAKLVTSMLDDIRWRHPRSSERTRPNGRVLKTMGNPMPGGGYVTSFTDITAEKPPNTPCARPTSPRRSACPAPPCYPRPTTT
jgi:hypothetical protein